MINNPRKFAITWLLEPTKKVEEAQYEYVFTLADYHSQELIATSRNETRIRTGNNNDEYYIIKDTYPADFPIVQAKLFKKASGKREYLGIIEYLGFDYAKEYSLYSNKNTSEWIETTKYIYYLNSGVSGLLSYFKQTTSGRISTLQRYNHSTGDLTYSAKYTQTVPASIFTANYYRFSTDTYVDLSGARIRVYGMSYSGYELKNKTIYIYPEQPDYEWTSACDGVENSLLSFNTYMSGCNNNFYDYQDYLFKSRDSLLSSFPSLLVKCSDGLNFETYMAIAQETQYFNKNTTITFEHD